MIWIKKEGAEFRRGVNVFGWRHPGLCIFLAGYKWRLRIGIVFSLKTKKFTPIFDRWDFDEDIRTHIIIRGLYTRQEAIDLSGKISKGEA